MYRYLCMVAFWLPTTALAKDLQVISGWHETFTRLVVDIPVGSDWEINSTEDGYELSLSVPSEFNLASAFDKIPRERVENLISEDGKLKIFTACKCGVDSFLYRPDMIVIDILDESVLPTGQEGGQDTVRVMPRNDIPEIDLLPRPTVEINLNDITPLNDLVQQKNDFSELESMLIGGLTRAADQGLLELNLPPKPSDKSGETDESRSSAGEEAEAISVAENDVNLGITARTSADAGLGLELAPVLPEDSETSCWSDTFYSFDGVDSSSDAFTAISEARNAIYGDSDRINPEAVTLLARTYLAFGFGREAMRALDIDGKNTTERIALDLMAKVIEGESVSPETIVAQSDCDGTISLLIYLANPKENSGNIPANEALVRIFKTLPEHIQDILRERFASRLLETGRPDLADIILADGASKTETSREATILEAKIDIEQGNVETAKSILSSIDSLEIDSDSESFADQLRLMMNQGLQLESDIIETLETLRFTNRNDSSISDLNALQIEALVYMKMPESALILLKDVEGSLAEDVYLSLVDEIGKAFLSLDDPSAFLKFSFGPEVLQTSGNVAAGIYDRLKDLGFQDRAEEIYREAQDRETDPAPNHTSETSISSVAGRTPIEVELSNENIEGADRMAEGSIDLPIPEDTASWRSSDWLALLGAEDPVLRDTSNLVLDEASETTATIGSLENSRLLVEQAAQTREKIDGLLTRFPMMDGNQ